MPDHAGEFLEQAAVAGGDADRPVGGVEGLVRHEVVARGARALRLVAAEQVAVQRACDPGHSGFEQRGVDHAAFAGAVALLQRGENADGRPHAGRGVVDCRRAERRRILRTAGQRHHRAKSLRQRIKAGRIAHRSLVAERPDRAIDQPRIDRSHHVGTDADLLDNAGPEILDHHIGIAYQKLQPLDIGLGFDVDGDRPLVAIGGVEHQRGIVDEGRSPHPRIVAAIGLLDLDHVGAHVGEDGAGQRACERLAHLDHLDACKRSRHGSVSLVDLVGWARAP